MSMPRITAGMRRMGSTLASAADFQVMLRAEVTRFLAEIKSVLAEIHGGKAVNGVPEGVEEKKEQEASGVVA